jgi:hypothetical protein
MGPLAIMGIGAGVNAIGGLLQSRALRKQARAYGRIGNQLQSQYSEAADPFRGLLGELQGINAGQLGYERAGLAYRNPALQADLEASLGIQKSRREFANMQNIARIRQQAQIGSAAIGAAADIEATNLAAQQSVIGEIAGLETEGARLNAQMQAGGADLRSQARQGIAKGIQEGAALGMDIGARGYFAQRYGSGGFSRGLSSGSNLLGSFSGPNPYQQPNVTAGTTMQNLQSGPSVFGNQFSGRPLMSSVRNYNFVSSGNPFG